MLLLVFLACRQLDGISTLPSTLISATTFPKTSAFANALYSGMTIRYIALHNRQRSNFLYIPPLTARPSQTSALVFTLYGGLVPAQRMLEITGFNAQANKSGFIAVCPGGSGRREDCLFTWNADRCCGYVQE